MIFFTFILKVHPKTHARCEFQTRKTQLSSLPIPLQKPQGMRDALTSLKNVHPKLSSLGNSWREEEEEGGNYERSLHVMPPLMRFTLFFRHVHHFFPFFGETAMR
jgi:hypothetical protein